MRFTPGLTAGAPPVVRAAPLRIVDALRKV